MNDLPNFCSGCGAPFTACSQADPQCVQRQLEDNTIEHQQADRERTDGMSNLATDNEFIYTKRHNREDCRSAWKHPPPHTVMDRWVRCHVVGDKVVLGPALKEPISSTNRAALERMAEKDIFGKEADVHEKRERQPTFFDIYVEQANRIDTLEQAIRQLLYSHKDGFHGCCWCGVGVGEAHAEDCQNRRAHQLITDHDEQEPK